MTTKKKELLKRKPADDWERKVLSDRKERGWHIVGVLADVVKVRVTKDRAFLGGRAVIIAKGELLA